MDALIALIQRAQAGDREAFGAIVLRFQDMAVGYGYALLSDFHLAEDAAQEAFLQSARRQLKERMLAMVQDNLHEQAPSRDERFAWRVTAAVDAVLIGDVPALTTLLDQEPDLANARSPDGRTLLSHLTDWPGHRPSGVEIAQLLINAGADINARTIDSAVGETPLQWAVSANDVAVAEALIDAGASVDGVNDDRRPLAQALFYGQLAAAELLVRRGATIDLEFAAGLGRLDLLQTFFDAAGNLLPTAGWHHPPTNQVILAPDGAASELLEQALVYACICTQVEAAAYLLDRGADVNAQPSGFDVQASPLHWAAGGGNVASVELLLARGADPSARDPAYGGPPYGWAQHHGHNQVCDLLRRHDAAE